MKKVRQKKWIGAAISAVGTIANAFINSSNQLRENRLKEEERRLRENIQNSNAYLANMNQVANTDTDWAYDKFKPTFRCGGKRRMKSNLGKYKPRF